jgi:hypothetical protein
MARPTTYHDWQNCDCRGLCPHPIRIALITFTLTGALFHQVRRPRYGSGAFRMGTDPADFERRLQRGDYDPAPPRNPGYYLRGAAVLDKRTVLRAHPQLSVASPMVEPELADHAVDACPQTSLGDALAAQAARGGDATFHTLLREQRAAKNAGLAYGPLDHVSVKTYVRWWAQRGARAGYISEDGNALVWPDAKTRPDTAVQGDLGL